MFFATEKNSIVYIYPISTIHSSVDGHWLIHFLAV